jgi:methyl-accepting chemotaxis protein
MVMSTPYALMQVGPARDTLSIVSDVAGIVIAAVLVVLAILAGLLLLRVNRLLGELQLTVRQNLGPVSDRARSISENLGFVTQALRSDVEQLHGSVEAIAGRLHLASERMEERIEEFNALMEVVQGEAEEMFLDTASTVRGVREGARSIAAGGRARSGGEPPEEPPEAPEEENALAGEQN